MTRHAAVICKKPGAAVCNIGFGLGLIDSALQQHSPHSHTIIEAHPDVYAHMCKSGWASKPGVRIVFGRWQDVLPGLGPFDGLFFDTYAESYHDLRSLLPLLDSVRNFEEYWRRCTQSQTKRSPQAIDHPSNEE